MVEVLSYAVVFILLLCGGFEQELSLSFLVRSDYGFYDYWGSSSLFGTLLVIRPLLHTRVISDYQGSS